MMDLGIEEVLGWEGELEDVEVTSPFPSLQVWAQRMSFLHPKAAWPADRTKICFPSHRHGTVQRTAPTPPSIFMAEATNPQIKPEISWCLWQGSGLLNELLWPEEDPEELIAKC